MRFLVKGKIINHKTMNQRITAIITGMALLLMAIIAGYALGFAYAEFYSPELTENVAARIAQNSDLYNNMLIGILLILILDLLVSYTLYHYFKDDHKLIAISSGIIRFIYTLIFTWATYSLFKNLSDHNLTHELANSNFKSFETIWYSGLVLFGFHVLLLAYLMKLHQSIPQALWGITLLAGVSYVVLHLLKLGFPEAEMVKTIEMILTFPMALGELGLAIWLLIKGGKALVK